MVLMRSLGASFFISFSALLFTLSGCSSPEREAEALLKEMQHLYTEGRATTGASPRETREQQLALYERVLSTAQRLQRKYPDSLIAQGLQRGNIDLGGTSLSTLRDLTIPNIRRLLLAESDPLTAVRVLTERIEDADGSTRLLIQLARALDQSGRSREADEVLDGAFVQMKSIPDRSLRVERLSAIAFAHANASRRAKALEVAFAALAEAKQVSEPERRANALSEIALSYYILGISERGYEALLSIQDRATRIGSIEHVSRELLARGLTTQVIAVSSLLIDPAQRASFLLSQAEHALSLDLSGAALSFTEQLTPLLARVPRGNTRSQLSIRTARVLREAARPKAALSIVRSLQNDLGDSADASVLLGEISLELALLNQPDESRALTQRLTSEIRRVPTDTRDQVIVLLARTLSTLDEPQQALPLLRLIEKPQARALGLVAAASAAHEAGGAGFARKMLEEAEALTASMSNSAVQIPVLHAIRNGFVEAGLIEEASRVALSLPRVGPDWRRDVRNYHSILLSRGYTNLSLEVARALDDPALRGLLLAESAKRLYQEGRQNDAFQVIEEAVENFDKVKDSTRRQALIALVADSALEVHWPTYALKLVERYALSDTPVWFCRIAATFATTGQREDAIKTLGKALAIAADLPRPADQGQVLLRVGETLASLETVLDYDGRALLSRIIDGPTLSVVPEKTEQSNEQKAQ
jgi:tetratricopeptide (TPR) repeat protein